MTPRRKGVLVFLAIAFLSTWGYLFAAKLLFGWSLVNPLVQLPGAFLPAVAAAIARRWVSRDPGADAGNKLRLRAQWRLYVLAWLGPLALTVASVTLAVLFGLWKVDLSALATGGLPWWGTLGLLLVAQLVLAPLYWGEESGWTNYLRPRIFAGQPVRAVLVTGLIWAVWHYPLAFLGYTSFDQPLLAFPVWTALFMCQQMMLSWFWARTGSIWPTSIAHAGNNVVNGLVLEMLLRGGDGPSQVVVMLLTVVPLLVCGVAIVRSGGLTRRSTPGPNGEADLACGSGRAAMNPFAAGRPI